MLLASVNTALLRTLNPEQIVVDIEQAGEAEIDEMWSFVGNKGNPRWLWHAIDHHTSAVLAYVFGRRKDEIFRVCSKDTGFIQPVHDAVLPGFVDGLRRGLHATCPAPGAH